MSDRVYSFMSEIEKLDLPRYEGLYDQGFETGYLCSMLVGSKYMDQMRVHTLNVIHVVSTESVECLKQCAKQLAFVLIQIPFTRTDGYVPIMFVDSVGQTDTKSVDASNVVDNNVATKNGTVLEMQVDRNGNIYVFTEEQRAQMQLQMDALKARIETVQNKFEYRPVGESDASFADTVNKLLSAGIVGPVSVSCSADNNPEASIHAGILNMDIMIPHWWTVPKVNIG